MAGVETGPKKVKHKEAMKLKLDKAIGGDCMRKWPGWN